MLFSFRAQLNRSYLRVFLACALTYPASFKTTWDVHQTSARKLAREVAMGTGLSRFSDTCLIFIAQLASDDFFEGLEVQQTPAGPRFMKNSRPVTEFPTKMSVNVLTWARKCGVDQPQDTALAKLLLDGLHFTAEWKAGLKSRPVREFTLTLRRPSTEEWFARKDVQDLRKLGSEPREPAAEGVWIFEIRVEDQHVPLTDSLVVTVHAADGKRIGRFSGRL